MAILSFIVGKEKVAAAREAKEIKAQIKSIKKNTNGFSSTELRQYFAENNIKNQEIINAVLRPILEDEQVKAVAGSLTIVRKKIQKVLPKTGTDNLEGLPVGYNFTKDSTIDIDNFFDDDEKPYYPSHNIVI